MYSWDEIRQQGDCQRYMREVLGMTPIGRDRFNCPWRSDSDSGGMKVEQERWYDHVEKVGGGILELCAKARHNDDLQAASQELGQWLCLQSRLKPRPAAVAGMEKGQEVVATYDYHDADGRLVAQKLRLEPGRNGRKKDFRWRRRDPSGGWEKGGLQRPVLYRLPDVRHATSQVIICEGEKDADLIKGMGHVATSTPDGANNWNETFTESLRGCDLVICHDNDDAGRSHAELIIDKMLLAAKSIKLLCPSDKDKGDVYDWYEAELAAGNDNPEATFAELLDKAPEVDGADLVEIAKEMNQSPFANTKRAYIKDDKGRLKEKATPKTSMELIRETHARFLGFPHVVGSTLFDVDRDTREIRYIRNPEGLSAWMGEKSGHPLMWGKLEGCVSMGSLYESLLAVAKRYQMISGVPSHPPRDDVYYMHDELPPASEDLHYFKKLCSFFTPATAEDAAWIKAFFATCFYFDPKSPERPLWIIDSVCGQGAGKSSLVEVAAYLLGTDIDSCSPIVVPFKAVNNESQTEQIMRRVLSATGRRKRILLLDNVVGEFSAPELASWVTSPTITGRPPYGRGEETRPNDITYCVTANSAVVDSDLAKRAIFIYLDRPQYLPGWKYEVKSFIDKYRYNIIADIFANIDAQVSWEANYAFRMASWDKSVLRPLVDELLYYKMIASNTERQGNANVDEDIAERIRSKFVRELGTMGVGSDDVAFIQTSVAISWVRAVFREEKQMMTSTMITQKLSGYAKTEEIPELSRHWKRFPHNGNSRKRGFEWNYHNFQGPATPVHMIGFKEGKPALI